MPDLTKDAPPLARTGKTVDPAVLEVLGKRASLLYLSKGVNLNDAVVKLASGSNLSAEHVRRVAEFANNATHQSLYAKSEDKLFNFPLADPEIIIQDLHNGAGHKIPVISDRDAVREVSTKVASQKAYFPGIDSVQLKDLFVSEDPVEPLYKFANPHGDLERLFFTAQDAENQLRAQRDACTILLDEAELEIQDGIKQASLFGMSMRDIVGALGTVAKRPDVLKTACAKAAKTLGQELHFMAQDQTVKTASRAVNPRHPLLQTYRQYEDLRVRSAVLEKAAAKLSSFRAGVGRELNAKLLA
jgi:hypothetical protein